MQISAEIRWFFSDAGTASSVRTWFTDSPAHAFPLKKGKKRVDEYLSDPGQKELGIKHRGGGGIEIKGLIASGPERVHLGDLSGTLELWCKWSTEALPGDWPDPVQIEKTRWLRKFALAGDSARELPLDAEGHVIDGPMPEEGCNAEFTELQLAGGECWWTLGLEAFGDLDSVRRSLRLTLDEVSRRKPPAMTGGICASYPAWMSQLKSDAA